MAVNIRKTPAKVSTKPVAKKEEVVEETTEKAPAKKVAKAAAPAKKETAKKAPAKATKTEAKLDLSTTKKVKGIEDVELGKCGSLKKDDFYIIVKDRLEKEYGINLGSKENVSKIFSVMEDVIVSALKDANTFHFGGKQFNRKSVNARVYNPPIGKSYLVMPHFNMRYSLSEAENIVGEMDGENFVADDGTVYTPADLENISKEFFAQYSAE